MKRNATPVSWATDFQLIGGGNGTFTAKASSDEDGGLMAIQLGLNETSVSVDEMKAIRDCINAALVARETYYTDD